MRAVSASATARAASAAPSLDDAYSACARIARAHYENFPVASWLLPRQMRAHVAAVYAFARVADDMADEGDRPADERHRLLDGWLERLRRATSESGAPVSSEPSTDDLVFQALGHTIRSCDLPVALFEDLVSAFRQDIATNRYASWESLFDYCRRSANPVGRLVLRMGGYRGARLEQASDALCTALQLTNFWQDLARDWLRGRLYVPLVEVDACGAREADLAAGRLTPAWRSALERAAARTRGLFDAGRGVADGVGGRLAYELRLTWLGGSRLLERLERQGFDVFTARPTLGSADAATLLWRMITWSPAGDAGR